MSSSSSDELLKKLLEQVDQSADPSASGGEPPSEEMLAQFAEGTLSSAERTAVVRHLAESVSSRQLVSQAMKQIEQEFEKSQPLPEEPPQVSWRQMVPLLLVVAAMLILVVFLPGLLTTDRPQLAEGKVYQDAVRLLKTGEFREVERRLTEAEGRGVTSARLINLDIQARRGIPNPIALSALGRLSDFGYGIGGTVAMGAEDEGVDLVQAAQTLQRTGDTSIEILLNRGHLQLTMGNPDDALLLFEQVLQMEPENAAGHLGRGLASYMRQNFEAAARDFRAALRSRASSVALRMNLAMALEELGQIPEAIELWQDVLGGSITEDERTLIRQNIRNLEAVSEE